MTCIFYLCACTCTRVYTSEYGVSACGVCGSVCGKTTEGCQLGCSITFYQVPWKKGFLYIETEASLEVSSVKQSSLHGDGAIGTHGTASRRCSVLKSPHLSIQSQPRSWNAYFKTQITAWSTRTHRLDDPAIQNRTKHNWLNERKKKRKAM